MIKKKLFQGWLLICIFLIGLIFPAITFAALGSDPRSCFPAPGGTDVFAFYYKNITGNEYRVDGNVVDRNVELNTNVWLARYCHFWELDDKWTTQMNVIVPFGDVHTELQSGGIDELSSGIGDITLCTGIFYSFLEQEDNRFYMAGTLYLVGPTGQYNQDKMINFGSNRWGYFFQLTPVIWQYGPFSLEVFTSVEFFTANTEYTSNFLKLEQDPVWTALGMVAYDITKTFTVGAIYAVHTGGETKINDVYQNNKFTEHEVSITAAILLTPQFQLQLKYSTDVSLDNGIPKNTFQTKIAYFF